MLPTAIRGEDGIRPGDELEIDRVVPKPELDGRIVDWLRRPESKLAVAALIR